MSGREYRDSEEKFVSNEATDARHAGGRYARGNVPAQDDAMLTPRELSIERQRTGKLRSLTQ